LNERDKGIELMSAINSHFGRGTTATHYSGPRSSSNSAASRLDPEINFRLFATDKRAFFVAAEQHGTTVAAMLRGYVEALDTIQPRPGEEGVFGKSLNERAGEGIPQEGSLGSESVPNPRKESLHRQDSCNGIPLREKNEDEFSYQRRVEAYKRESGIYKGENPCNGIPFKGRGVHGITNKEGTNLDVHSAQGNSNLMYTDEEFWRLHQDEPRSMYMRILGQECTQLSIHQSETDTRSPSQNPLGSFILGWTEVKIIVADMHLDLFIKVLKKFHGRKFEHEEESGRFCPTFPPLAERRGELTETAYAKGIWLDFARGNITHRDLARLCPNLRMVAFNTFSSTKAQPCFHIFIPTSRSITSNEYQCLTNQIVQLLFRGSLLQRIKGRSEG
jgi:hypothetical protein